MATRIDVRPFARQIIRTLHPLGVITGVPIVEDFFHGSFRCAPVDRYDLGDLSFAKEPMYLGGQSYYRVDDLIVPVYLGFRDDGKQLDVFVPFLMEFDTDLPRGLTSRDYILGELAALTQLIVTITTSL